MPCRCRVSRAWVRTMMSSDAQPRRIASRCRCRGRGYVHHRAAAEHEKTRRGGRENHVWKIVRLRWTASALVQPGSGHGRVHCRDHFRVSTWRRAGADSQALLCASSLWMWTSLRALGRMGARVLVSRMCLCSCLTIGGLRWVTQGFDWGYWA